MSRTTVGAAPRPRTSVPLDGSAAAADRLQKGEHLSRVLVASSLAAAASLRGLGAAPTGRSYDESSLPTDLKSTPSDRNLR